MAPSAEREISNTSSQAGGHGERMTLCHESSSSSLDDGNDRGRSIAKGGVTTP